MDAATQAAPPRAATEAEQKPKPVSLGMGYFEQILPAPPRVCGIALKPLSIGRYRRMKRQNVAFVAEESREATVGDLLQGVIICSMSCADYDEFLASPDCEKEVCRFGERIGFLPERYHRWGILGKWFIKFIVTENIQQLRNYRAAEYLREQLQLFQEYILAGQQAPNYWDETSDSRVSAAHWSHSIECVLREKQGWTKHEIDEEPLTKALWDYFKSMESAGLVRLMTDGEAADISRPLTPEEEAESRVAAEKLWRYKFGDAPLPATEDEALGVMVN